MSNLDRFAVGLADPQDKPASHFATCPCGCREAIHFGDEDVWEYDGDLFVDAEHFAKWYGARRMDGVWS